MSHSNLRRNSLPQSTTILQRPYTQHHEKRRLSPIICQINPLTATQCETSFQSSTFSLNLLAMGNDDASPQLIVRPPIQENAPLARNGWENHTSNRLLMTNSSNIPVKASTKVQEKKHPIYALQTSYTVTLFHLLMIPPSRLASHRKNKRERGWHVNTLTREFAGRSKKKREASTRSAQRRPSLASNARDAIR